MPQSSTFGAIFHRHESQETNQKSKIAELRFFMPRLPLFNFIYRQLYMHCALTRIGHKMLVLARECCKKVGEDSANKESEFKAAGAGCLIYLSNWLFSIQMLRPYSQSRPGSEHDSRQKFSRRDSALNSNVVQSSKKKIGEYYFYLNDSIGSGFSSDVYKCYHKYDSSKVYAMKVVNLHSIKKANHALLKNEIKILSSLNHPNVLRFHDVYYTQNNCYIVTDYCEGGNLQQFFELNIERQKQKAWNYSEKQKREQIFKEIFNAILEGCQYLSENLIIHRDIKPANIFLKQSRWMLGDFGFARFIDDPGTVLKQKFKIGSPLYMPPETLIQSLYSLKTDSFAVGITLFYLNTGQFPWPGATSHQLQAVYKNANLQFPMHLLTGISQEMKLFIKGLCCLRMQDRLTVWDYKQYDSKKVIASFKVERLDSNQTISPSKSDSTREGDSLRNAPQAKALTLIVDAVHEAQQEGKDGQSFKQQPQLDCKVQQTLVPQLLGLDNIHRIKFGKFLNYMSINLCKYMQFKNQTPCSLQGLELFNQDVEFLIGRTKTILKLLVRLYEWSTNQSLNFTSELQSLSNDIYDIRAKLELLIHMIDTAGQREKGEEIIAVKCIQYWQILGLLLAQEKQTLNVAVGKVVLHPDFFKVYMSEHQIREIFKIFIS